LAALLIGLMAMPAGAGEASPEHGKINTPDATPVDPGQLEVEGVYGYGAADRAWDSDGKLQRRGLANQHAVGIALTAGLVDNVDIAVATGPGWLRDKDYDFDGDGLTDADTGRGLGDTEIGLRWRFYQSPERALDLAWIGGFTIPTGSKSDFGEIGTSQEFWSFNQTLAASRDWGRWTGNAALGYALPFGDRRGDAQGTLTLDVAIGYQLLDWLQPELELNYARDLVAHDADSELLAATFGLVMPVSDDWRVNAGIQHGLWGRTADRETAFTLAVKRAF
jgi:hypothetical protein